MRLSWNEVRARAAAFAEDWKNAAYEKGETQSFYKAFFEVFGVRRRNVARYEAHVAKLDHRSGFIDLFWPGVLIVEQKSAGRDLKAAYEQAGEYFDALPERERPRYILVSDFQTFELRDLDEQEVAAFRLADLPAHVEAFGFIIGVQRRTFRDQDPANIKAAELVGRLHDTLAEAGHRGHDLERFLVRVVFCMFADDTGVFEPRDIFLDFIETRTGEDGADLGPWIAQLFEVLDTPEDERAATLDEDLARFPYINGDLFEGHLRTFSFDSAMRGALLDACRFDWSNISPAIFGALFQSVMDPVQRRAQGAHYTTEKNILKVIEPLFMDDLRAELKRVRMRRGRDGPAVLRQFQANLRGLTFFDPACGCGNFLIVAYRELRMLEIEVIREIVGGEQKLLRRRAQECRCGVWGSERGGLGPELTDATPGRCAGGAARCSAAGATAPVRRHRELSRVTDNWIFYWRFLAHLQDRDYRPRTVQRYHQMLRFLSWLDGRSLRSVVREDIERYLLYRKAQRQRVAYTIRYTREVLAAFFQWLMQYCSIEVNPAAGLRIRLYYPQPERLDLFSHDETLLLVRAPARARERLQRSEFSTEHAWRAQRYRLAMQHLILKLLFSTGMRPCEIVSLELQDVDHEQLKLRVRAKGRQRYLERQRSAFITARTAQQLQELLAQAAAVRSGASQDRLFIHHRGGKPLASGYVNIVVKQWAARCGIARTVYAYMARYTFCTRLVENGADLYSLKRLMGHTQTAVTLKHYLKLTPSELRREWKEFNPLVAGVKE